jgi:alpha-ketoglutarate-dependent taurine dioxygenase
MFSLLSTEAEQELSYRAQQAKYCYALPVRLAPMIPSNQTATADDLAINGWSLLSPSDALDPVMILAGLGRVIPSQKDGIEYHDLQVYDRASAPRLSMSAFTGTDAQPMHTDAAYAPMPPRYIALQCIETGGSDCPTHLWVADHVRLLRERPPPLAAVNWVVRGGNYSSFYCSIITIHSEGVRVRFDPYCMSPTSGRTHTLDEAALLLETYTQRHTITWLTGSLLIVDNWRCLHARGQGGERALSRRLRRWAIEEGNYGLGS